MADTDILVKPKDRLIISARLMYRSISSSFAYVKGTFKVSNTRKIYLHTINFQIFIYGLHVCGQNTLLLLFYTSVNIIFKNLTVKYIFEL